MQDEEIVFVDTEVSESENKLFDIGAVRTFIPVNSTNGLKFHSYNIAQFEQFIKGSKYVCGHNIICFDYEYIKSSLERMRIYSIIDTLFLAPLLFPAKPYHRLVKDDKIQSEELNNPLNDSIKAMELFMDEVTAFECLSDRLKKIYCTLLIGKEEFCGFFRYMKYRELTNYLGIFVHAEFKGKICEKADIDGIAKDYPIELAYCLATISTGDKESIIPYWVQKNYPRVQEVYRILRGTPCSEGCVYCKGIFDIHRQLKIKFGYDEYRKYGGEPLQEKAVQAAVDNKSLLAIFPTGGGKSLTFQIPALIAAEATHGLTVVISPLQSLMKDQVDNLSERGITDAVTINGLLNSIERSEALERVENGIASILYISPESLRSRVIERILLGRNVNRFVIDEAHCFSAWGQDFRVDYQYIGDFIRQFQEKKNTKIPVSCFTATAKQKVISDIKEYFKQKLNIELDLYTTNAARTNLRYEVLYKENDIEKYAALRDLVERKNCPTIVYVSRTKKTIEIANKLCRDGFSAKAFNGKMDRDEKVLNQDAFIRGDVKIMVATSAFGMGVDKKDVKLVVHYDISDSLENYIQEAGRAGRDQSIEAECYVLFNEDDLNKHFILLNQTKLSINEIQQTWRAIKNMTKDRNRISCSALEIARQAGWDDTSDDIETKVKTAIMALENAGYISRGQNCPRVYADSICVKNAQEAIERINASAKFAEDQKEYAVRIIKKLISTRSRSKANNDDAESRVDYIADHLGIPKSTVIEIVNIMKDIGILANDSEMYVYVERNNGRVRNKKSLLNKFLELEGFLVKKITDEGIRLNYKKFNEEAINSGINHSTVNNLRILLYFWIIKGYIKKPEGELNSSMGLKPLDSVENLKARYEKRITLCKFIEQYFIEKSKEKEDEEYNKNSILINFSIIDIKNAYNACSERFQNEDAEIGDVTEALLYLNKINAFKLEGGFLVLYNAMSIKRLEMDNKIRYKVEDYKQLKEHYELKTQQIHIVGEFANMMVRDYESALMFVNDYFGMEYKLFLTKYFEGSRMNEITRNITPMKYQMLFENLSPTQSEIISDDTSAVIVVAAGPGSGKTKILVHKLASLMLMEDVKHEQLLLLTFSRTAAMEFKERLIDLIGNAAHFVEIKTFHSYCFDLLGKVGNIKKSQNVVGTATDMILNGDVELDRITKTVLVIDEAQDMDENEYGLVRALQERNEDMRIIAVGDDDQNIYAFRGSDSKYMEALLDAPGAKMYELVQNFRSSICVVQNSNIFAGLISKRMKHEPISAVKEEKGGVWIIKNTSSLVQAAVNKLEENKARSIGVVDGTVAILTETNEQAYLAVELLNRQGYKARLVQSNEGFSLYDLAEVRFLIDRLKFYNVPVINDEIWERTKLDLQSTYSTSKNLEACMYMIKKFEEVFTKKYCTDVECFFRESEFEDFYRINSDEIYVSTIHKSKGREFDDVYMMISSGEEFDDKRKRNIYVGMTRAKSNLFIFHNSDLFGTIREDMVSKGARFVYDNTVYPEPDEIVMSMSHKDVYLDFFKRQNIIECISEVRAGDTLEIKEEVCGKYHRIAFAALKDGKAVDVVACSKGFAEKIREQKRKGYVLCSASVNYSVKWWDKEARQEYTIILPIVRLKKIK